MLANGSVSTDLKAPADRAIPFAELKIDALLVSAPPNVRYLSGFTGDNGLLLLTPHSQTLFTDPRFTIQAAEECTCEVKTVTKTPLDQAAIQTIRKHRWKRIGFEASRMLYETHQRLDESLPKGVRLKPIGPVVEKLRMIKSDAEIARIRRSVLTNSEAFEKATRSIGWASGNLQLRRSWNTRCGGWERRRPHSKPSLPSDRDRRCRTRSPRRGNSRTMNYY